MRPQVIKTPGGQRLLNPIQLNNLAQILPGTILLHPLCPASIVLSLNKKRTILHTKMVSKTKGVFIYAIKGGVKDLLYSSWFKSF